MFTLKSEIEEKFEQTRDDVEVDCDICKRKEYELVLENWYKLVITESYTKPCDSPSYEWFTLALVWDHHPENGYHWVIEGASDWCYEEACGEYLEKAYEFLKAANMNVKRSEINMILETIGMFEWE